MLFGLGFKGRKTFLVKVFFAVTFHVFDLGLHGSGLRGLNVVAPAENQPATVETNSILQQSEKPVSSTNNIG